MGACSRNVGSSLSGVQCHVVTQAKMRERQAGSLKGVKLNLRELLRAGIEMHKANNIRGWLERHMGVPLLDTDKLATQHIGPLGLLEP